MGAFWRRLLGCERRTERFLRIIEELDRRLTAAEQELMQLRSLV
jgi:hypothetical protein